MSDDVPLGVLVGLLIFLLGCSAFFSGSETALMRLNRYRLRHKAKAGHRGAKLAEKLLEQPDRLIGLILLGNNLANILASQIVAVIAFSLGGTLWFAASGSTGVAFASCRNSAAPAVKTSICSLAWRRTARAMPRHRPQ